MSKGPYTTWYDKIPGKSVAWNENDWKKALDLVKKWGFEITSESNWYEMEWDGDRAWYPKIKFEFLAQDKLL